VSELKDLVGGVMNMLKDLVGGVISLAREIVVGLVGLLKDITNGFNEAIGAITYAFTTALGKIWEVLTLTNIAMLLCLSVIFSIMPEFLVKFLNMGEKSLSKVVRVWKDE
jgi:hypothetical protein